MAHTVAFAVVEVHTSPWDAHVARALLESEGIPTYLGSEHVVSAWWPMSFVFGGVRLLVRCEHVVDARAIFTLRDQGELEAALAETYPAESMRCTRCGSEQFVTRRNWPAIALAFTLLFIGRVIFPPAKALRCKSCGELRW